MALRRAAVIFGGCLLALGSPLGQSAHAEGSVSTPGSFDQLTTWDCDKTDVIPGPDGKEYSVLCQWSDGGTCVLYDVYFPSPSSEVKECTLILPV